MGDFGIVIYTVTWSDYDQEYEAEAATVAEALNLLQSIATPTDHPPLVQFSASPNGPFLAVAASDPSVVTFDESLDPPYLVSTGNPSRSDLVTFVYGCQESEMPARHLVPRSDAEQAIREFISTGRRPTCLSWEEV